MENLLGLYSSSPYANHTDAGTTISSQSVEVASPVVHFPTTVWVITMMHFVYLYQFLRMPRRNVMVTYRSIIYHKKFHRVWVALLSHPPPRLPQSSESEAFLEGDSQAFSTTAVAMGGPDSQTSWQRGGILQQTRRNLLHWGYLQWQRFATSGLPLLLYNSHILWSCRALEELYNEDESWKFARCGLSLVTLALSLELSLSHVIVQATIRRQQQLEQPSMEGGFGEVQPNLDLTEGFLEDLRTRAEKRAIGTMTSLAAAVLVLFRFRYPQIPLAVLPFFTDRLLTKFPGISFLLCIGMLGFLSRFSSPLGVFSGAMAGVLWAGFRLDSLANASNGNWLVLAVLLLTIMSLKGRYPSLLPCIEYVSWYDDVATNDTSLSWCFRPVPLEEDQSPSDTESVDQSAHRAEEAVLEFTRVRSDSNEPDQNVEVDPDLLEQGRRPRRTRIRSQRL